MVKLRRIDLTEGNLEELINAACQIMSASGHALTTSFVLGSELVLIFVKP